MSPGPNESLPVALAASQPPRFAAEREFEYPPEQDGGLDLRRYLAAVLRHKWMILGLGVLGFGAGVGVSRVVKPMYETQATVQIEVAARNGTQSSPVRNTPLMESRAWLELMRSFFVLDEVVRRQKLFVETPQPTDRALFAEFDLAQEFTPGRYTLRVDASGAQVQLLSETGAQLGAAPVGDSLGLQYGFRWVPRNVGAGRDVRFTVRVPRDASVQLSRTLQTILPEDGAVVRVQLQGTDPAGIAHTVNAVTERFVEVATLLKRENLTTRREVLKEQLSSAQVDLTSAENALERFKIETITEPTTDRGTAAPIASGLQETRDPVRQAFFKLRLERDSLARERDAVRRSLRDGADGSSSLLVALGTIPSVRGATELSDALATLGTKRAEARQLRLAFASTHAPLVKLDAEIAQLEQRTVPEQARILADNLDRRVAEYDARIGASSREMQMIPVRATEETRRERQVDIAKTIYTQLQAAYEEARLAELSAAPDVRLLDRAVAPTRPITDRLLFIIAGGLAGGLGLGVLLALLLDRFDRRIRYPEQVTQELGLSILGALPMVENGKGGKPNPEQASQLLEALRSIRMNLGYAHGAAGTLITTVTSPGAGDGKSFVSANLAKAFSSSGRRTLLIDADTRRGLQHRTMGVDRKPGLLDYLSGNATREQIVRSIPAWGIDFIPCGTRMAGGPELLSSPQMAQLILGLRAEYQVMIVDSPPIGAGVDPLVLASLCGSLVMVLRTGVTDRELAESRLHELQRLPIRVLGAVLNDVKPEGIYRYYAYIPGYRSEDEVEEAEESPPKRRLLGLR